MTTTLAAVAAPFGRDLDACFARIDELLTDARARGVQLLALPEAALGGYLADLVPPAGSPPRISTAQLPAGRTGEPPEYVQYEGRPAGTPSENLDPPISATDSRRGALGDHGVKRVLPRDALPPALDVDGPEIARLARMAGDVVVTAGFCESDGTSRYNTVVAVTGDGVLGVHRKVHQPLGESNSYAAGDRFCAFDSPVGRLGMLICYDKAFPEAARTLALDGAEIIVCVSAWPAARTAASPDLAEDRWTHRFDLFDRARALENQVVWVASNQSGTFGSLRFVCSAKVVGPGGDVLATTGVAPGMAVADVDVPAVLAGARRSMAHLRDRRPETYGVPTGV